MECIENAAVVDGDCVCVNSTYFPESNTCASCSDSCTECYDIYDYTCETCAEGFYQQPFSNICHSDCPSGFSVNDETQSCDNEVGPVACFTFSENKVDYTIGDVVLTSSGP